MSTDSSSSVVKRSTPILEPCVVWSPFTMINQLTEKLIKVKKAIKQAGSTLKSIVEDMVAVMKKQIIAESEILLLLNQNKQLRY